LTAPFPSKDLATTIVAEESMKRGHLVMLLVEDDENDIYFVRRATEHGGSGHTVYGVRDGEDAIRYLRGKGQYANRHKYPLPNVILTDLKMPGMDGFDFLRWLRRNVGYSIIPTIVYSSSRLERDVRQAYKLGANCYLVKPNNLDEMVEPL
jgi:CheY-like chemotaxis protein